MILYPFEDSGQWGFINNDGEVVVPSKFEYLSGFSSGLAVAKIDDKFGYLDKSCKFCIAPQYEDAGEFVEQRAIVTSESKVSVIDENGATIVPFGEFDKIRDFSEGFAVVSRDALEGFISSGGVTTITPQYKNARSFAEGVAAVRESVLFRYVTQDNHRALNQEFLLAKSFSEGYAAVQTAAKLFHYIDRVGLNAFGSLELLEAHEFSEGLAAVQTRYGWGYIDRSGGFAISPNKAFFAIEAFSEGLAKIWIKESESEDPAMGFINRAGEQVIPPQFAGGRNFHNGLAWVYLTSTCMGYVDKAGKVIWKAH
jgi:hypothetical protein